MAVNLSRKYKFLNRTLWNTVSRKMSPQNMLSNSGLRYHGLKHLLQFPNEFTTVNRDGFAFGQIPSTMSDILVNFLSLLLLVLVIVVVVIIVVVVVVVVVNP
jgi:hypothetical protein